MPAAPQVPRKVTAMKTVSCAARNTNHDIDSLSAELTETVYSIVMREASPQRWLEFKIRLWIAVRSCLVASDQECIINATCCTTGSDCQPH